ncbi:hypothetical protein E8E14_000680 [Neopestalotiopsis sp. 37M]|nr:hypothetical protein E8E14_000680 [Neopestalotiopsis sp. 37M]
MASYGTLTWLPESMERSQFLFLAITAVVFILLWHLRRVGSRPRDLPPGPPTIPIAGNLNLMPQSHAWIQYAKWAKEYGPIFSLILGTKTFIVVTSDKVVKDLFEKRSKVYSSRPELYLGWTILGSGLRMASMKYGDTWRSSRRLMHSMLHVQAAKTYIPYQDLECKQMLADILETPYFFADHIKRFTYSLTLQMVFGLRTSSIEDPKLVEFYENFDKFGKIVASQSSALLDLYPILRRLPETLLPALKETRALSEKEKRFYVGLWLEAKTRIQDGSSTPCFCEEISKTQEKEAWSDDLAAYTSGSALEGGSDTSSATLVAFVQAMILYPEAQKLVRDEIERVCGDEMPELEDEVNLPMVRACGKEILRWWPITPFSVPHSNTEEDEYMGYRIPKDSTVLLNTWGIHFDPDRYKNPEVFDPTRYAGDNSTSFESASNPDISKRDHFGFGVSRRVCQGVHVVDKTLFFAISRLIWAFDITKAKDEHGREITPDRTDMADSQVAMPSPFRASITPRSPMRAAMVRKAWGDCQELLDGAKQWKETPSGISFRSRK